VRAEQYFEALRACPVAIPRELTEGRPFVVLSPHPDDETLGAGGLIAGARSRGEVVDIIVVTDGSGSHPRSEQYPRQRLVDLRYAEVHKAGLALGLQPDRIKFLGLERVLSSLHGRVTLTAITRRRQKSRRQSGE
jgi:LmbE family N-acetylglucosaminyl deacetylase